MFDCCGGHKIILMSGAYDICGNMIAIRKDMTVEEAEEIISGLLIGECPVCNGLMT